jgi:PAS domain S-box-containing protein/putative nucleotidyltransferase with HDIG domain
MTCVPLASEPQSLFELSWTYAPGGMFAFDSTTGELIDANPSAETLSGYSREEVAGLNLTLLHPENERERVKAELLKDVQDPARHDGFHMLHKDGSCAPVGITSSKSRLLDGRQVTICVYFDTTEAEQREHRLATKRWALTAYAGAALALRQKHTPESLLTAICEAITRESHYLLAWVGIAEDGPGKRIRVAAAAGNAQGYLDGLQLSWAEDQSGGRGPTAICIRTRQLQIVKDTESSPNYRPWKDRARAVGIRSSLSVPFVTNASLRGALVVYAAHPNAFEAVPIEVFVHLAEQIGHGLHALDQERLLEAERAHLAKMQVQLTEALSAMVAPIVLAMEMRDPYTAGHQSRVAEIAVAIGRELGWPEERVQGLRVAAQVHDIGKISIPAEILTKPGTLNSAEWAMIKTHPETGYTILKDIPFAWEVAEIVRQHHEKLDGSGYPRGLKGDEMLPEAKVLAVADIVEAMSSYRPYRQGIKLYSVLQEIERQSTRLLDAEAVRACMTLFHDKHFILPGWIQS